MQRSRARGRELTFSVQLDEAEVKRLAGAAAFARGNAWQRGGHVHNPVIGQDSLGANILGTWRRFDKVSIAAESGTMAFSCTCHREGSQTRLCRHATALLLQWLREPASFTIAVAEPEGDSDTGKSTSRRDVATPEEQFKRLLEVDTTSHLREIARARGARITARNKSELLENLAPILIAPGNLDAALEKLDQDERLALVAADLMNAAGQMSSQLIGVAYRALNGEGQMQAGVPQAIDTLVNLGLVFPGDRWAHPSHTYIVPQSVAVRIALLRSFAEPIRGRMRILADSEVAEGVSSRPGDDFPSETVRQPGLDMVEVFQVIAHEFDEGRMRNDLTAGSEREGTILPSGWRIDPTAKVQVETAGRSPKQRGLPTGTLHLVPVPSLLAQTGLHRLAGLTGQPVEMIDFALSLMLDSGIFRFRGTASRRDLILDADELLAVIALHPTHRLTSMIATWLNLQDAWDFRSIVGNERPLQLHLTTSYYSAWASQPQGTAVRRLVTRVIGALAGDERGGSEWYDFQSLLDLLWTASPHLLNGGSATQALWWFSTATQPDTHIKLDSRAGWQAVWRPLVAAILSGPMTWLRLVEVAGARDNPVAFRVLPAGMVLTGRELHGEETPESMLLVDLDPQAHVPTVVVPPGMPNGEIYSWLSRLGNLTDASNEGLRYVLTAEKVQMAFDDGLTGTNLVSSLERCAGGTLPDSVREILEAWCSNYGTVRLYDEVTLIELGEDVLLRELLATTSLDTALLHTFSSRLVAIDPSRVDGLLSELTRLGHTPRVIEDPE